MATIPTSSPPAPSTEAPSSSDVPLPVPGSNASRVVAWVLVVGAVALVPLAYMRTFEPGAVHPLGWDSYAYVWEAGAVGPVGLAVLGSRPGPAVLGSFLVGALPVPAFIQPLVTSMAMVVALGLATAVTVRRATRLPIWTLGLIAAAVGLWGGIGRLAAGYEANLMGLTIFVTGVSLLALAGGAAWSYAAAFGMFLAADLVHPGLAPVFTGILLGVAIVSAPWILGRARAGDRWWRSEPVVGAALGVGALACAAAILLGPLGLRLSEIADFSAVSTFFDERLAKLPEQIGLWVTLSFAAIGLIVAWRLRARTRASAMVSRLGIAWLVGSIAALVAVALGARIPGHRVAYMALPVTALCGVAIAGLTSWITGPPGGGRRLATGPARWGAGILAGIACVGVLGWAGLVAFSGYAGAPRSWWEDSGRQIAAYVDAVQPDVPIVMVVDREGLWGALSSKVYLNAAKAQLDPHYLDDFTIYVGQPDNAVAGLPTLFGSAERDWYPTFDQISEQMWASAGPAIAAGATILMPREAVRQTIFEQAAAEHPERLVTPDLYVARGPVAPIQPPTPPSPISSLHGLALISATWIVFALAGGGFGLAVAWQLQMSSIEALGWSAALGVGVCVIACFILAMVGGDPSSYQGVVAVGAVTLVGYWLGLRRRPHRVPGRTLVAGVDDDGSRCRGDR